MSKPESKPESKSERIEELEKKRKRKQKEKVNRPKDESSIAFYIHSSLFVFFLTSLTFLLFLYKNQYPLILDNEILPEILFLMGGLFVVSFVGLLFLSISGFLTRLVLAVITGASAAYILGLLYPYNIGEYMVQSFLFLPQSTLQSVASKGNMFVGIGIGVIFFFGIKLLKGSAMAFLSLPVLCVIFFLLNASSKQQIPEVYEKAGASTASTEKGNENVIYLMLSDHVSYSYALEKWQEKERKISAHTSKKEKIPYFLNDFFQSNNFIFYPQAYTRYADKYRSVGNLLNPKIKDIKTDMFHRDNSSYYSNSEEAKVTIDQNDLFKEIKKKGYTINIYQTHPFNFCGRAGTETVDKCFSYPAPLGALYNTNMTTASRLLLLTGHWLHSFPAGESFVNWVSKKMIERKLSIKNIPFVGNPMAGSLPVGQEDVLSRLRLDVQKAKGKNFFFAHLTLPYYPFAYDKYCQLKPSPERWRSMAPYPHVEELNGEEDRWDDYNQQLACTYGQINYMIKELEAEGQLQHTKIIIHGDKGAGLMPEDKDQALLSQPDAAIERLKRNMSTIYAVYNPGSKKPEIKKVPCDIPSLTSFYLLGTQVSSCRLPDLPFLTKQEREVAEMWLSSPAEDADYTKKNDYDIFYKEWLKKGGQAFMASAEKRQKGLSGKLKFAAPPAKETKQPLLPKETVSEEEQIVVPVPDEKSADVPDSIDHPSVIEEEIIPPMTEEDKKFVEETLKPKQVDVILDEDISEQPKPIVLPEIDEKFAQSKWKLVDEKDKKPAKKQKAAASPELPALAPVGEVPSVKKAAKPTAVVLDDTPDISDILVIEEEAVLLSPPVKEDMVQKTPEKMPQQEVKPAVKASPSAKKAVAVENISSPAINTVTVEKAEKEIFDRAFSKEMNFLDEKDALDIPSLGFGEEVFQGGKIFVPARGNKAAPSIQPPVSEKAQKASADPKPVSSAPVSVSDKKAEAQVTTPAQKSSAPVLVNKEDLDVTREIVTEKISPTGEKETYIFIERKRAPRRAPRPAPAAPVPPVPKAAPAAAAPKPVPAPAPVAVQPATGRVLGGSGGNTPRLAPNEREL